MGQEGRGPGWYSLQRKQDLWKLLPSHCTSSAKYTAFWHTPHFFPPPQFGILRRKQGQKMFVGCIRAPGDVPRHLGALAPCPQQLPYPGDARLAAHISSLYRDLDLLQDCRSSAKAVKWAAQGCRTST